MIKDQELPEKLENAEKEIIINKAKIEQRLQELDKERNEIITKLIQIEGQLDLLNKLK